MPGQLLGVEMTVYLLAFRSLCPLHCECLMYKSSQDALRNADAAFVGRIIASRDTVLIAGRSEEHTSELQSRLHLVCRLLLEKKKNKVKGNTLRVGYRV